jgi:hypothetical protein
MDKNKQTNKQWIKTMEKQWIKQNKQWIKQK